MLGILLLSLGAAAAGATAGKGLGELTGSSPKKSLTSKTAPIDMELLQWCMKQKRYYYKEDQDICPMCRNTTIINQSIETNIYNYHYEHNEYNVYNINIHNQY